MLSLLLIRIDLGMKNFLETQLWIDSINFYNETSTIVLKLKRSGYYRLSEQFESSCGSICDNIAEGFGRGGNKELIQFLAIARGSCHECMSQVYRIEIINFISSVERDEYLAKLFDISKQLNGFSAYLQKSDFKGVKYKSRNPES